VLTSSYGKGTSPELHPCPPPHLPKAEPKPKVVEPVAKEGMLADGKAVPRRAREVMLADGKAQVRGR
jgi:hypothetical protein